MSQKYAKYSDYARNNECKIIFYACFLCSFISLSVCTVVKVAKHTLSITVSVMFKGVQSFCSTHCYI